MMGEEGRPLSRAISGMIAGAYLVMALTAGGIEVALRVLLFCIIPVSCIWFPDILGDYTGVFLLDSITAKSPASFVWFLGWVVLLLPVIVFALLWLQGVRADEVLLGLAWPLSCRWCNG